MRSKHLTNPNIQKQFVQTHIDYRTHMNLCSTSSRSETRLTVYRANSGLVARRKYFLPTELLNGLSTVWLVTAQKRRLDGFYARCLRRILRIPAAFVSRISNAAVFKRAGVNPLSAQILRRQLNLLFRVAAAPAGSPLRQHTFIDDTIFPQIGRFVRKVGRPRQDWTNQLLREGTKRFGAAKLQMLLTDLSKGAQARWKSALEKSFTVQPQFGLHFSA